MGDKQKKLFKRKPKVDKRNMKTSWTDDIKWIIQDKVQYVHQWTENTVAYYNDHD